MATLLIRNKLQRTVADVIANFVKIVLENQNHKVAANHVACNGVGRARGALQFGSFGSLELFEPSSNRLEVGMVILPQIYAFGSLELFA